MNIKFNGSQKQNQWASDILQNANLADDQINNLLRYGGPKLYAEGIMDVTVIIENRHNLAAYADSLGKFYGLSDEGKRKVAKEAVDTLRKRIRKGDF